MPSYASALRERITQGRHKRYQQLYRKEDNREVSLSLVKKGPKGLHLTYNMAALSEKMLSLLGRFLY
jgi:hypothetical protein